MPSNSKRSQREQWRNPAGWGCWDALTFAWALAIVLLISVRPAPAAPRQRAAAPEGIVMGPYLQHTTATAVTIIWWTDFATEGNTSRVEYGPGFGDVQAAVESDLSDLMWGYYRQQARIEALHPNTTYPYRVRSSDGVTDHVSGQWTFTTAPDAETGFHFAVLGDGRTDTEAIRSRHRAVLNQALAHGVDMIVYAGDMVGCGSSTEPETDRAWEKLITEIFCSDGHQTGTDAAHRIPIFMVVGNHEIYRHGWGYPGGNLETSMARFKAICDNPANGSSNAYWEERYYAFWYGPCYFIVLDANNTPATDFSAAVEPDPCLRNLDNHGDLGAEATPGWGYGDPAKRFQVDPVHTEQYNWLIEKLTYARNAEAAFTFVCFHPAPYSRGTHGKPADAQCGYQLRALDPVFRHFGVDAVFASHDHMVERCLTGTHGFHEHKNEPWAWRLESNLNYFVAGNSGEGARTPAGGWETWMDITGNDAAPFHTVYYYPWAGDNSLASFLYVHIAAQPDGAWKATFSVVRTNAAETDVTEHDAFYLTRPCPLLSVASTPLSGVLISGMPWGRTDYVASIAMDYPVAITAPEKASDGTDWFGFVRWVRDGADQPIGQTALTFTADGVTSATAVYEWTGPAREGDFDGDGDVDFWDFMDFIGVYNLNSGDPGWAPDGPIGDFDDDDDVDFWDFMAFVGVYGT